MTRFTGPFKLFGFKFLFDLRFFCPAANLPRAPTVFILISQEPGAWRLKSKAGVLRPA